MTKAMIAYSSADSTSPTSTTGKAKSMEATKAKGGNPTMDTVIGVRT